MPIEVISCGPPTTIAQTITYALPASRVFLVSSAVLEVSLQPTTGFTTAPTAHTTTGIESAFPFCRCTGSTAIVSIKKV